RQARQEYVFVKGGIQLQYRGQDRQNRTSAFGSLAWRVSRPGIRRQRFLCSLLPGIRRQRFLCSLLHGIITIDLDP
ncbi:MAG: hypothetical protein ACREUR_12525, partial [Nitrosospira sp.]